MLLVSFNKENNADLNIESKMLKNNAAQKPETVKPSTNLSAKIIITALITKINKPKVTRVAGNVKKIKSGLTTMFSNAITIATIIADI